MNLGNVLQGKKYGRSTEPAEDMLDRLQNEVLFKSDCKRLRNHLNAIVILRSGDSLAKLQAMTDEEYKEFKNCIKNHKVALLSKPSKKKPAKNITEWFVLRRLNQILITIIAANDISEEEIERLMIEFWDTLQLWPKPKEAGGFDLDKPCMRHAVGDFAKAKAVRTFYNVLVKQLLTPLLDQLEEGKSTSRTLGFDHGNFTYIYGCYACRFSKFWI